MNATNGGCLCGAVMFDVQLPSKWVAHCHCSMCRRAHGAAFVTWLGVPTDGCQITDSQQQLRWHASSADAERGFCARCGSPLFFRSTRWPGELHIARAQIHDPVDREPQAHVYWDSHVSWVRLDPDDGLPRKPVVG